MGLFGSHTHSFIWWSCNHLDLWKKNVCVVREREKSDLQISAALTFLNGISKLKLFVNESRTVISWDGSKKRKIISCQEHQTVLSLLLYNHNRFSASRIMGGKNWRRMLSEFQGCNYVINKTRKQSSRVKLQNISISYHFNSMYRYYLIINMVQQRKFWYRYLTCDKSIEDIFIAKFL